MNETTSLSNSGRRPSEAAARKAIEAWLDYIAPGYPTYDLCPDGDDGSAENKCGWAFWIADSDSTSYVHEDLKIEWCGTGWPDFVEYHSDTGMWRDVPSSAQRMEDRINVVAESASTTQHQLTIYLDGVRQFSVDNTARRAAFVPAARVLHGDYRDWMHQTVEEASPWLKVWFVQRALRFTNGPVADPQTFERRYDASIAHLIHLDRVAEQEPATDRAAERERG